MSERIMNSTRLAKMFESASHGSEMFEMWNAFVTSFAAMLAAGSGNECDWLIERAAGSTGRITKRAAEDIPKLYDPVIQAFEVNPWQDLLGDTYMRLNIGNKNVGQFFTPYNVAEMMARLSLSKEAVTTELAEHGYVTINEPAAGGGANIIGCAVVLKEMGINFQRHMWFVAQELSELAALTCYVQCSLLGMAGVVQVGDTLRTDFHHSLYTPICVIEDVWTWRLLACTARRAFA